MGTFADAEDGPGAKKEEEEEGEQEQEHQPPACQLTTPTAATSISEPHPHENTHTTNMAPVVLVSGFLGCGGDSYWGMGSQCRTRRVIVCHVGPVSSLHDRACELFYQLKGGRCCYGHGHSVSHGHAPYGRVFCGLYPEWSSSHPIHIVGHSFGGMTVHYLHNLLAQQAFPGHITSSSWIRSVTCISSPLLGSQVSYILGSKEAHPGGVYYFSPGSLYSRFIHIYEFLDISWLKQHVIDYHLDHWELSRKHGLLSALRKLSAALLGYSSLVDSRDNAAYDLSIQGALEHNHHLRVFPSTYYHSYTTSCATPTAQGDAHVPIPHLNATEWTLSHLSGHYQFDQLHTVIAGLVNQEWHESDSTCPTVSQYHPHYCTRGLSNPIYIKQQQHEPHCTKQQQPHVHGSCEEPMYHEPVVELPTCSHHVLEFQDQDLPIQPHVTRTEIIHSHALQQVEPEPSASASASASASPSRSGSQSFLSRVWSRLFSVVGMHDSDGHRQRMHPRDVTQSFTACYTHIHGHPTTPHKHTRAHTGTSSKQQREPAPHKAGDGAGAGAGSLLNTNSRPSTLSDQSLSSLPHEVPPHPHLSPGHWHVHELRNISHIQIIPCPITSTFQHRFFAHLYAYLDRLDRHVHALKHVHAEQQHGSC